MTRHDEGHNTDQKWQKKAKKGYRQVGEDVEQSVDISSDAQDF